MKFNINSKDFKELAEKAITCVNKKAAVADLTRIYLNVTEDGKIEIRTSNLEHYLILEYDNIFNFEPGFCTIDNEDLKVVNKLSGIFTVTKEENKLIFDNGKKKLSIPCYDTYNISFPALKEEETKYVISVSKAWMLETLVKLDTFTTHIQEKKNIAMECFNFNTAKNRIEALDGHRIGIRLFPDSCKLGEEKSETTYMLSNKCVPVFKKVLDKKSNDFVEFYTDGNYNKLYGLNFVYYSKCTDATNYWKVEKMLYTSNYEQSCFVNRESLMEIAKYNKDLENSKEKKMPMVLKCKNDTLYSYMETSRYETLDSIETHNLNIKEGFTIAFNPAYLFEGLNIMEMEDVRIDLYNSKAPALMTCNDWKYLLLPVNLNSVEFGTLETRIEKLIA